MAGVSFHFTAQDNTKKAFATISKNFKDIDKTCKQTTKSVKSFGSSVTSSLTAISVAVIAIGKVVKNVVSLIVNIIKSAIKLIKNLVTGIFNFIKSALSTLLSWMKTALGKVFDWITSSIKKTAQFAINTAKKAVKAIVEAVQAYADKEYNVIQLRMAYGDDFNKIEKELKNLLKYTTSDKNDLWSIVATYAEMGKTAQDALKYARATVYLSNATGKSLDSITRMLLLQEAMSRDLNKTLAKVGVQISNSKTDISDIEKIISQMKPEMEALTGSLNQKFANVKNAWITIKESIGSLFAGPVGYVADKLTNLLERFNKAIINGKPFIEALFDNLKPIIDKVFDFLARVAADPAGFIEALWKDIKQIFSNIRENFSYYLQIFAYIIGHAIQDVIAAIDSLDWSGMKTAFNVLKSSFDAFKLGLGVDSLWEDVFKPLLKRIWDAITGWFSDHWSQIRQTFELIGGLLAACLYNALIDSPIIDLLNLIPGVNIGRKSQIESYQKSIYTGLTNTPHGGEYKNGVSIGGTPYNLLFGIIDPSQITKEWLASEPTAAVKKALGNPMTNEAAIRTLFEMQQTNGANLALTAAGTAIGGVAAGIGTGSLVGAGLGAAAGGFLGNGIAQGLTNGYYNPVNWNEIKDALDSLKSFDSILETKPLVNIIDELENIWGTTKDIAKTLEGAYPVKSTVGAVTDANRAFREIDAALGEGLPIVNIDDIQEAVETGVKDALTTIVRKTEFKVTPVYGGKGHAGGGAGGGGGGVLDYFSTSGEFKIKPYAKGGLVDKPTLALVGEAGPELVVPMKDLPKLADADAEKYNIGTNVTVTVGPTLSISSISQMIDKAKEELNITKDLSLITEDTSYLVDWYKNTATAALDYTQATHENEENWLEKLVGFFKNKVLNKNWWKEIIPSIKSKAEDIWYNIRDFFKDIGKTVGLVKYFTLNDWGQLAEAVGKAVVKGLGAVAGTSLKGIDILAGNGAFGEKLGRIYEGIKKDIQSEEGFSIWKAIGHVLEEILPYLEKGLKIIGKLFDEAFDILGNVVSILGEKLGKLLLPILEAFIPLMKEIADILIALAPVFESILKPTIIIIAAILRALVPILDLLMPAFAGIGAVIQWISDAISWAVGSFLNWLASIDIFGWRPFAGVGGNDVKRPTSIRENYNTIMGTYNEARANITTGTTSTASTAAQTASYNGATRIYITNDFNGANIVGAGGMTELAKIIRTEFEDLEYQRI